MRLLIRRKVLLSAKLCKYRSSRRTGAGVALKLSMRKGTPMRNPRTAMISAAVVVFALGTAVPAAAGPTTATVTITGGVLAISVPTDAGNLGTRANTVAAGTISGPLGQVQVNDARNAAAGSGWIASAISTAFTPPAGPTLAASLVGYTAGTIVKTGTATYTANDPAALTGVSAVVTATAITGSNSATWNPTITVTVPGGTVSAVYSGTITHSLV